MAPPPFQVRHLIAVLTVLVALLSPRGDHQERGDEDHDEAEDDAAKKTADTLAVDEKEGRAAAQAQMLWAVLIWKAGVFGAVFLVGGASVGCWMGLQRPALRLRTPSPPPEWLRLPPPLALPPRLHFSGAVGQLTERLAARNHPNSRFRLENLRRLPGHFSSDFSDSLAVTTGSSVHHPNYAELGLCEKMKPLTTALEYMVQSSGRMQRLRLVDESICNRHIRDSADVEGKAPPPDENEDSRSGVRQSMPYDINRERGPLSFCVCLVRCRSSASAGYRLRSSLCNFFLSLVPFSVGQTTFTRSPAHLYCLEQPQYPTAPTTIPTALPFPEDADLEVQLELVALQLVQDALAACVADTSTSSDAAFQCSTYNTLEALASRLIDQAFREGVRELHLERAADILAGSALAAALNELLNETADMTAEPPAVVERLLPVTMEPMLLVPGFGGHGPSSRPASGYSFLDAYYGATTDNEDDDETESRGSDHEPSLSVDVPSPAPLASNEPADAWSPRNVGSSDISELRDLLSEVRAVKARIAQQCDEDPSELGRRLTDCSSASKDDESVEEQFDAHRRASGASGGTFGPKDAGDALSTLDRSDSSGRFSTSLRTIVEQIPLPPDHVPIPAVTELASPRVENPPRKMSLFPSLEQLRTEQLAWKLSRKLSAGNFSTSSLPDLRFGPSSAAPAAEALKTLGINPGDGENQSSPVPTSATPFQAMVVGYQPQQPRETVIVASLSNAKALKTLGILPHSEASARSPTPAFDLFDVENFKAFASLPHVDQVYQAMEVPPSIKALKTGHRSDKPSRTESPSSSDDDIRVRRTSTLQRSNAKALKMLGIISRTDANRGFAAPEKAMKLLGLQDDARTSSVALNTERKRLSNPQRLHSANSAQNFAEGSSFLADRASVQSYASLMNVMQSPMELHRMSSSASCASTTSSGPGSAASEPNMSLRRPISPRLSTRASMSTLRRKSIQLVTAALPAFIPVPASPAAKISPNQILYAGAVNITKSAPGSLFRSWKRRYCVLTRGFLYLYPASAVPPASAAGNTHSPGTPSDVLYVGVGTEFRSMHPDNIGRRAACGFAVRSGGARTLYFACDDVEWRNVLDRLNDELRVPTRPPGGSLPRSLSSVTPPVAKRVDGVVSRAVSVGGAPATPPPSPPMPLRTTNPIKPRSEPPPPTPPPASPLPPIPFPHRLSRRHGRRPWAASSLSDAISTLDGLLAEWRGSSVTEKA
ncbi:hypothetical protein DFJ77DRAFT_542379 [Powellomyces hirtus]|nr:hypothetical protein DFJ77DRAFT_542379 [Powellomyces hirtus]